MKENLQQGGLKKKWREKVTKLVRFIRITVGTFTESYLIRQGYSKRIAKKMVWGEGERK